MTLYEVVKRLSAAGIDNPTGDARELLKHFGGYKPHEVMWPSVECSTPEFLSAVEARANHTPLQYLIGEVWFFHEKYKVTPDCLIPRADTEILVEYAVANLPCGARFLDLCTGSGCIALSTLCSTENTTAIAADISGPALKIAEENGRLNGVSDRLTLVRADLLKEKIEGEFFAILSNPPYVCDSVYEGLAPEIAFEPKGAFVGGADGGDFYRALTPMYRDSLATGGFIAYEIGYDQAELIKKIACECEMSCEIIKDLSGNDRVAILKVMPHLVKPKKSENVLN